MLLAFALRSIYSTAKSNLPSTGYPTNCTLCSFLPFKCLIKPFSELLLAVLTFFGLVSMSFQDSFANTFQAMTYFTKFPFKPVY